MDVGRIVVPRGYVDELVISSRIVAIVVGTFHGISCCRSGRLVKLGLFFAFFGDLVHRHPIRRLSLRTAVKE